MVNFFCHKLSLKTRQNFKRYFFANFSFSSQLTSTLLWSQILLLYFLRKDFCFCIILVCGKHCLTLEQRIFLHFYLFLKKKSGLPIFACTSCGSAKANFLLCFFFHCLLAIILKVLKICYLFFFSHKTQFLPETLRNLKTWTRNVELAKLLFKELFLNKH